MQRTIAENMIRMSDADLLSILPYVRDENGERMSIMELKHCLRETVARIKGGDANGSGQHDTDC